MAKAQKEYLIGIDTGGTFTDIVVLDMGTGAYTIAKAPTTPHDFSIGVMSGIEAAAELIGLSQRDLLEHTLMVKHGTTVATNAIINRRGAKVGFITTKGFEDTTFIGRAVQRIDGLSIDEIKNMPTTTKPEPIVPKSLVKGVYERIDFRGNIVIPMDVRHARDQIRSLVEDEKVEALGVSLIFGYVNPVHEKRIKELINEMYPNDNLFLTFAHELVPLGREYSRANTVILNGFIGALVQRYLSNLENKLCKDGFKGRFLAMQCNGGTVGWETVPPIRVISSGPTGGVIGSQYIASMLKHPNVISTDMGGTSFDVSLLRDGKWDYEREPIISRWRIMLPMIKVESIGAGGGTIARVDPITGRLLVGPDSAGAAPGPVCYEAGGTEPTVCDANLILGLLNPDYFLGGRMKVNKAKAEQAIRDKIATPLKMDMVEAAAGIYTIVNAHMAELIRVCAMGAGLSPEEFVLYAFGGTGPLHAAYYAKELNIKKVYVFPFSSVFSAFGVAGTDIIRTASFSMSYMMPVAPRILDSKVREFEDALALEMEKEGFRRRELEFRHMFNMRYRRQVNYHTISLPGKEYKTDNDTKEVVDKWVEDFEKVYGKGVAYTRGGIEVVSMDIDVIGKTVKPILKSLSGNGKDPGAALKGHRRVFFPEITKDFVETRIYEYDRLRPKNEIEGPAIIENATTTIVVPPGRLAKVDPFLSVVIEL